MRDADIEDDELFKERLKKIKARLPLIKQLGSKPRLLKRHITVADLFGAIGDLTLREVRQLVEVAADGDDAVLSVAYGERPRTDQLKLLVGITKQR
jgi:hypothetical protein